MTRVQQAEEEVLVLAEDLKAQGSVDENARAINNRGLEWVWKIGEEEETLRELSLEVRDRKKQQEEEKWSELEEYIASWDTEKRRTNTLTTNMWHNSQKQCDKSGEVRE